MRSALATVWAVIKGTVDKGFSNRATGLAAEGAFFALLSLPPLVFGLAGSIGYVVGIFGSDAVAQVKNELVEIARQALTEASVQQVIVPTLDSVLDTGRVSVISIGFLIALWSGSRALHVAIDGITIMYGLEGERGPVKARLLSLGTYVAGLAIGVIALPLVLFGPTLLGVLLPDSLQFLGWVYWPVVTILGTLLLGWFYHFVTPGGTHWRGEYAGAVVTVVLWLLGSLVLRTFLSYAIGGTSIYGPLAAPIVVLMWLYLIVLALLIGAAVNASLERRRSES